MWNEENMARVESEILEVHQRWLEAEMAQDTDAMAALLHDDLQCVLPGGRRVAGKQAFLELIEADAPRIEKVDISNLWMSVDAEIALKIADFETHYSDSRLPAVLGTHTWGLKKEKGEWRIHMMTWTIKVARP